MAALSLWLSGPVPWSLIVRDATKGSVRVPERPERVTAPAQRSFGRLVSMHSPPVQVCPEVQTFRQRPQCEVSTLSSASQPVVGSSSQSSKPVVHSMPHSPLTQTGLVFALVGQEASHSPQ